MIRVLNERPQLLRLTEPGSSLERNFKQMHQLLAGIFADFP